MAIIDPIPDNQPKISQKICTKCGETFPATAEYFAQSRQSKEGLYPSCLACGRARGKHYYARAKVRVLARQRQRKNLDPETSRAEARARTLAWRQKNPERAKANAQRLREKDPEAYNARQRAWTQANPDKRRARDQRFHEKHPEYQHVKNQRYLARKKGLPSTYTPGQWRIALAYWHFCCAVCEQQADGLFHTIAADHWIPLASPECPGTICTNMLPLCHGLASCNISKGSQDPGGWLRNKLGSRQAKKKLKEIETFFAFMSK